MPVKSLTFLLTGPNKTRKNDLGKIVPNPNPKPTPSPKPGTNIGGGGGGNLSGGNFTGDKFPVTGPNVPSNILSLGLMASQTEARLILKK